MHFSVLALLSQDEAAIARILRENNRFNEALAKLDAAGPPEQQQLVEQIRSSQDEAMAVVADMANAIRDRKLGAGHARPARTARSGSTPRSRRASANLVATEQRRMARLRDSVAAANRDSLVTDRGLRGRCGRARAGCAAS